MKKRLFILFLLLSVLCGCGSKTTTIEMDYSDKEPKKDVEKTEETVVKETVPSDYEVEIICAAYNFDGDKTIEDYVNELQEKNPDKKYSVYNDEYFAIHMMESERQNVLKEIKSESYSAFKELYEAEMFNQCIQKLEYSNDYKEWKFYVDKAKYDEAGLTVLLGLPIMTAYISDACQAYNLVDIEDRSCTYLVINNENDEIIFDSSENQGSNDVTEDDNKTYEIGETWIVEDQWELTINSVSITDERNQFSDYDPAQVLMIDYEYKNIGYDNSEWTDGLFIDLGSGQVIDSKEEMGYEYPGDITHYPQATPIGAKCKAQACIGMDNDGSDVKIIVSMYDDKGKSHKATFKL